MTTQTFLNPDVLHLLRWWYYGPQPAENVVQLFPNQTDTVTDTTMVDLFAIAAPTAVLDPLSFLYLNFEHHQEKAQPHYSPYFLPNGAIRTFLHEKGGSMQKLLLPLQLVIASLLACPPIIIQLTVTSKNNGQLVGQFTSNCVPAQNGGNSFVVAMPDIGTHGAGDYTIMCSVDAHLCFFFDLHLELARHGRGAGAAAPRPKNEKIRRERAAAWQRVAGLVAPAPAAPPTGPVVDAGLGI